MKKLILFCCISLVISSCKGDQLTIDDIKTGTFEIPAGKGYEKTIIIRSDSLQIEKYQDHIDTLSITWKNNFEYTLQMLHPKNAIDEEPIHVKIKSLNYDSYDFEAVIGKSDFIQKGTTFKRN